MADCVELALWPIPLGFAAVASRLDKAEMSFRAGPFPLGLRLVASDFRRVAFLTKFEATIRAVADRIGAVPLLMLASPALLLPGFASLPPMDRDEPRFAQASKQMLETSDFVDIRFGGEARNKKPVGIHWLQAAAVGLGELAHVADARRQIWLYRLPSLLGGICTVLFTYWGALALISRRGSVAASLMIAATLLLGAESRLATTDAVLAATVAAAMGALAQAYLDERGRGPCSFGTAALFWIAIGVGILIKGPVAPMVALFAAVVLSVPRRSARWLLALRPVPGVALCLLIVVPWFALILWRTHGTFLTEAAGHDLLAKVAGPQELHGAPAGSYLLAFWFSGWPLAPFVALAAPSIWRHRREPEIVFLLAWLVPSWLLFEVVPTKLFHYVLPLHPALAILAVGGLERFARAGRLHRTPGGSLLFALLSLVPVTVLGLVFVSPDAFGRSRPRPQRRQSLSTLLALFLAWKASQALLEQSVYRAMAMATVTALPVYLFVYGWLLTPSIADRLAVSPRLASAASGALGRGCAESLYATVGDREPSLMFLTDTKLLMTDAAGAARFLEEGPCRVAFVGARDESVFAAALDPDAPVRRATRVEGTALNGGGALDIGVYVRQ